jgi:hypothetical protein
VRKPGRSEGQREPGSGHGPRNRSLSCPRHDATIGRSYGATDQSKRLVACAHRPSNSGVATARGRERARDSYNAGHRCPTDAAGRPGHALRGSYAVEPSARARTAGARCPPAAFQASWARPRTERPRLGARFLSLLASSQAASQNASVLRSIARGQWRSASGS